MKFNLALLLVCLSSVLAQDIVDTATNAPATDAPDVAAATDAPDVAAPATDAPDVAAPATDAPVVDPAVPTDAPATDAPVPATDAPVVASETPAPAAAAAAEPAAAEESAGEPAADAESAAAAAGTAAPEADPTDAPVTTTPAPPTPSPTPTPDKYFRVTENKVTCIMFAGDVKFAVTYPTEAGKTEKVTVAVPTPSNETVTVTGSCQDSPQYINVSWGPTNTRSSFKLTFNSTGDKWELISTDVELYLDENTFKNATDAGKTLLVYGAYPGLSFVKVDTNSSFVCRAAVDSKNFTSSIVNINSTEYSVSSSAVGFSAQAYNSIPNDTQLQEGSRCEADITSDLVPIAVGCALAGLVVLVLISYLVGRRRRSAAYQSV